MELEVIEHEFNAAPFPLFTLGEAITSRWKPLLGLDLAAVGMDLQGTQLGWFLDMPTWQKAAANAFEKVRDDPSFFGQIERRVISSCDDLNAHVNEWKTQDFSKKKDTELLNEYTRFLDLLRKTFPYGLFLSVLDFNPPLLTLHLQEITKKRFGPRANTEFTTLTTNIEEQTFQKREELDFLRLLTLQKSEQTDAIGHHCQAYGFLSYGYRGPILWTEPYFQEMVQEAEKQNLKPHEKLRQHETEKQKTLNKIKELEAILTEDERAMFAVGRKLTYLKPWRKEMQIRTYPLAEKLLREIARRLEVPMESTRYMTETEMKDALTHGKIDRELLLERKKRCLVMAQNGKTTIYVGKEADRIAATIKEEAVPQTDTLHGTPATVGHVSGTACIVNTPEDMVKIKDGDILLSVATNPFLMPAIRKAAAIVTDQGGLTCHAAIVSREFNIPCVVGTRSATRVFKDGDQLDVDANLGIVKKR